METREKSVKTNPPFGLSFYPHGVLRAADAALSRRALVFTPNAELCRRAKEDPAFYKTLLHADILLPDGVGVTLPARLRGVRLSRAPGVEFGEALAARLANCGGSLFLCGGKKGVAERAAAALQTKYPRLRIAGICHGYLAKNEREELLRRLASSPPDALFICTGSPRQEEFSLAAKALLPKTVVAALGGSLDVYAGDVRRAPKPFRTLGCEWLWRTLCEPKRAPRLLRSVPFLTAELFEALPFWFKLHRQRAKAEESSVNNNKI